jgi:hypothetical protein
MRKHYIRTILFLFCHVPWQRCSHYSIVKLIITIMHLKLALKSKRLFNVKLNLSEYSNRETMKHRRAKISNKGNSTEGLTKDQKYDKRCYVHTYIKYPKHSRFDISCFCRQDCFFFLFFMQFVFHHKIQLKNLANLP